MFLQWDYSLYYFITAKLMKISVINKDYANFLYIIG